MTVTINNGQTNLTTDNHELALQVLMLLGEEPSPSIAAAVTSNVPAIGAEWPEQGGIYAGLMRGRDGHPNYHLIIAMSESDGELQWGGYGDESSATSKWDGLANTRALIEEGDHPAAEFASSRTIGGHSDFYLPAQAELMLAWVNVPEAFSESWHWSSTQYSSTDAFYVDFDDGRTDRGSKGGNFRVRPVRRFIP
ncbi:DUF1566 domain-containing protein [Pseudomonas delhiensis]|uniref:DUF1566 domain-containing protein n=1 Tax=Pseudomonas delhiensis TaxID=366289 RepID=UPI00315AA09C